MGTLHLDVGDDLETATKRPHLLLAAQFVHVIEDVRGNDVTESFLDLAATELKSLDRAGESQDEARSKELIFASLEPGSEAPPTASPPGRWSRACRQARGLSLSNSDANRF